MKLRTSFSVAPEAAEMLRSARHAGRLASHAILRFQPHLVAEAAPTPHRVVVPVVLSADARARLDELDGPASPFVSGALIAWRGILDDASLYWPAVSTPEVARLVSWLAPGLRLTASPEAVRRLACPDPTASLRRVNAFAELGEYVLAGGYLAS